MKEKIVFILNNDDFSILTDRVFDINRKNTSKNELINLMVQELKRIEHQKRRVLHLTTQKADWLLEYMIRYLIVGIGVMYDDEPIGWDELIGCFIKFINKLLKKLGREVLNKERIKDYLRKHYEDYEEKSNVFSNLDTIDFSNVSRYQYKNVY